MSDSAHAHDILRQRGAAAGPVDVAIVLGTGMGSVADALDQPVAVSYWDLPGFPRTGVSRHEGRLVVGSWEGTRVAVLQERANVYDTGDAAAMLGAFETLALLGARTVILTGSTGSLHPDWYPGSIAMIGDHIGASSGNPLIGARGGDARFVPLSDAYDRVLRTRMRRAAASGGVAALREGVCMWFSGPSFETPAESRMAKLLGADLVTTAIVPETILARRLGLKVVALSVITNFAAGIAGGNPTIAEVKGAAQSGSIAMKRLLRAFVRSRENV